MLPKVGEQRTLRAEGRRHGEIEEAEIATLELALAQAAMEIPEVAGPVANRIRVLRKEWGEYVAGLRQRVQDMMTVESRTVTHDLSIDVRTARKRAFGFLQNGHSRSFGNNHTVPVSAEWPAR